MTNNEKIYHEPEQLDASELTLDDIGCEIAVKGSDDFSEIVNITLKNDKTVSVKTSDGTLQLEANDEVRVRWEMEETK